MHGDRNCMAQCMLSVTGADAEGTCTLRAATQAAAAPELAGADGALRALHRAALSHQRALLPLVDENHHRLELLASVLARRDDHVDERNELIRRRHVGRPQRWLEKRECSPEMQPGPF